MTIDERRHRDADKVEEVRVVPDFMEDYAPPVTGGPLIFVIGSKPSADDAKAGLSRHHRGCSTTTKRVLVVIVVAVGALANAFLYYNSDRSDGRNPFLAPFSALSGNNHPRNDDNNDDPFDSKINDEYDAPSFDGMENPPVIYQSDAVAKIAAENAAEKKTEQEEEEERYYGNDNVKIKSAETSATTATTGKGAGVYIYREEDFEPEPLSPYELRYHNQYRLPDWAKKQFFFRTSLKDGDNASTAVSSQVCFVHVGKAAGSTVGCALGFKLHCDDEMRYPGGLLPRYTTHTNHNGVNDCWDDMGYYMFSLRDPLQRIQSWFAYEKPGGGSNNDWRNHNRQDLFVDCPFPHLNDLAEIGLTPEEDGRYDQRIAILKASNITQFNVCRKRAQQAITGEARFGYHAYFKYVFVVVVVAPAFVLYYPPHLHAALYSNDYRLTSRSPIIFLYSFRPRPRFYNSYQFYYNQLHDRPDSPKTITAIRQTHMVDDWNSMESLLGGKKDAVKTFSNVNTHTKDPADQYLSKNAQKLLCRYLCEEIQMYKLILRRAANLGSSDFDQSMAELRESCPVEADMGACPPLN